MVADGSESPTVEDIFGLLDNWRHLPAYRLEPRADPFFALFLPEVLTACLSPKSPIRIIPEFPIRIARSGGNNDSNKVDYLAVSKDLKGYLIELKTDMTSIRPEQIDFLKSASRRRWHEILSGLKSIAMSDSVKTNTTIRGKYFHLLKALCGLGLIKMHTGDIESMVNGQETFYRAAWDRCIEGIQVLVGDTELGVVCIIPKKPNQRQEKLLCNVHQVRFEKIAKHAENKGVIGRRFAKSLRNWKDQAGRCLPQQ